MDWRVLRRYHLLTASAAAAKAATEARAILIPRLEEMCVAGQHLRRELLERRDVVHDPERPAVRGDDEIALLEREIVDRHDRQIELQLLPVGAVVGREPHAALGPRDEQTTPLRILAHDARELSRVDAPVDPRPALAKILCLPDRSEERR